MPAKAKPFRVLCLDGGGMRGLYTASVLHTLSLRFHSNQERDIGSGFDLIVGTSTGGILAIALAYGLKISEVIRLYNDHGKFIFPDPAPSTGVSSLSAMRWLVKHLLGADPKGQLALKEALTSILGATTIEELYERRKIRLCIPSIRMESQEAWVFKTPHLPGKTRDNNYKLVDVCLATSAAPVLFPLAAVDSPDSPGDYDVFTDGGLWMNNPILAGLIEALHVTQEEQEIHLISASTASPPAGKPIAKDNLNWGLNLDAWKGGIGIAEAAMNAQAFAAEKMAEQFLPYLKRKNISLLRLPYNPPSAEQAPHFGLDKTGDLAIKVMRSMGKSDGEKIHGKCTGANPGEYRILTEAFASMDSYQSNSKEAA